MAEERQRREDENGAIDAGAAAAKAVDYVDAMTGLPPEVVTAVEPHEDGWLVEVEVLELARVPATTDILACYAVELDARGAPRSYRRIRRYHRARVGEE